MSGPFARLDGHEQVVFTSDAATGLRCIIAIYSTALGPAGGGTRFYPYADEDAALTDVLRLSRAMAYKAACAGIDLGGGKAVIIGDPATDKSEALLRAYGRAVASLGGRYVTACDVGTTPEDLAIVARETPYAMGASQEEGGSGDSGIMTAYGTLVAMRAVAERVFDSAQLSGRHVAIQGCGKVGRRLAELLAEEGTKLTVADVDERATAWCAERLGADVVDVDDVLESDAEILSPNALGGVLTPATIARLRCRAVVGAANNQLGEIDDATLLADAGILYAPDYVVNAGGLIQVSDELVEGGWSPERVRHRTDQIGSRLLSILDLAEAEGISTARAAERFAERRMEAVGRLRSFWLPGVR